MVLGIGKSRTRRHPGGTTVTTTTTTTHHPNNGAAGTGPTTRARKPSLMQRLRGKTAPRSTATTARPARKSRFGGTRTTRATAPATTHHRRKTSIGDKVSGAMLKLKGSVTRRPGEKAAGTRRMHGTDGRGSRRRYY
ncbi:hypothetical protein PV05_08089 [Exophiala xenobiotica]|uniref:Uncharacterized protein n=1 Tax=Exophiala xenobiotica TaxID=348802 RepID=A0A0D2EXC2_9EURO|nr:uncharacterized protein PV05_08089 [Exophiala xenobiotica]KIW52454.1 hypothetical protein PV05_08089 [Exophiala xenobiotica]